MMIINNCFELNQVVYLKTDRDQSERMVTDINVNNGGLRYGLACGTGLSWHYEVEITSEKDLLKTSTE